MESNSFFLQRALARGADWHVSYPALCMASSTDPVDERRKQIVVAAADDTTVRMAFFSSLGAILDFQASWEEMDGATRGWRGTRSSWLAIIGFSAVMFNFGIVNVFFHGLHSYSGLS